MEILYIALVLSSILSTSFAAPRNHVLEERQKDKTFTITCLGPKCPDNPPTTLQLPTSVSVPGGVPKSTSTPKPVTTTKNPNPPVSTKNPNPPVSTKKSTPVENPPTKTQKPPTTTQGEETGPSSTRCPVPLYYKCGGWDIDKPWAGCTVCVAGAKCVVQNEWYYQCVAIDSPGVLAYQ